LIRRTFESLRGVKRAIVHLYNSTSPVQRRVVFGRERPGIVAVAVDGARLMRDLAAEQPESEWVFQYSPESFTGTELEFARDISDAVNDVWRPTPANKTIINLPATVEMATPNVYADQIEWMHRNLAFRDGVVLSVHPHNDRGTGVAAAELATMAGAQRIEGCLFGNGERTGNVCIVTLGMNMYTQGVHPGLDFSDIDEIRRTVEYCNQMSVSPRHPYAGDLVFTAFSGSHQDAIRKGFAARRQGDLWEVPYLPVDPADVGRSYDAVVRVNSQSGKGGIAYLLEREHGLSLPRRLQIEFSQIIQAVTDATGKEMTAEEIFAVFRGEYLESAAPYQYVGHHLSEDVARLHEVEVRADLLVAGVARCIKGTGNGPIDAFVNSLDGEIRIIDYHEHSVGCGANATAVAYVEIRMGNEPGLYGVGMDTNIVTASIKAILSGINRSARLSREPEARPSDTAAATA